VRCRLWPACVCVCDAAPSDACRPIINPILLPSHPIRGAAAVRARPIPAPHRLRHVTNRCDDRAWPRALSRRPHSTCTNGGQRR
jgi:hypothetical protein